MTNGSNPEANRRPQAKYVFVCGMARSGTSVLARNIARFEDCTGFRNTGVPEDEGQFLQDVYAIASEYGGSSRCAFDPRAHRTETSELLTPQNITRLRASWHAHWDNSKSIFVEKTPENLLMTRFLQAAFPNSYFVVVRRHPVPVSIAGQRWKVNLTSLHRQFEHWLRCHEIFDGDKGYLQHVYELPYEDYVLHPERYHREIGAFLRTSVPESPGIDDMRHVVQIGTQGVLVPERAMETTSAAHNQKYFDQWAYLVSKSPFRAYYRFIAAKYDARFAAYGYSLLQENGFNVRNKVERGNVAVVGIVGPIGCSVADSIAFGVRAAVRARWRSKLFVKRLLPDFVLKKVRHFRQRAVLGRGTGMASSP